MIILVALFGLAAAAKYQMDYVDVNNVDAITTAFNAWAEHYGKSYASAADQTHALANFKANVLKIQTHNANPEHKYTLRMNHFGDMSHEEFLAKVLAKPRHVDVPMRKFRAEPRRPGAPWTPAPLNPANPMTVDWRAKGAVTPVKDQGQCGSCWAFSSTGGIEAANYLATGKLVSFSEQQLVDCSGQYGNQGCDGGDMGAAYQYTIDLGWLDTEASYPYTSFDGRCVAQQSKSGGSIKSYVNVTSGDDTDLENKSVLGTVSVAIDASEDDFQFYGGGLYEEVGCSQTDLDHGVLVVGYNYMTFSKTDVVPYWIVKNSWNTDWGDDGYIMMRKAETVTDDWRNMCGICTQATQPYAK